MATLRIPGTVLTRVQSHLLGSPGEHFAFMLARWTHSRGQPVFMVQDAILVPDSATAIGAHGWQMATEAILEAINAAVRSGSALIEAHNHGGSHPRFSPVDRDGLREFIPYVMSSLSGRPYAATVWGDSTVHGEYFDPKGSSGVIGRITGVGSTLQQIASIDDGPKVPTEARYQRQVPWFTEDGQRALGGLRVGIVGAGGTGSLVIEGLVYLGVRDFLVVDDDRADATNLNRLVTAKAKDLNKFKANLARRYVRQVAPAAKISVVKAQLQTRDALDQLKDVDVIFGCVDNDGARLILNELAIAYVIPLIDLAVGIDADKGRVESAGARIAVVRPSGPCLLCMDQIDKEEAAYFLSSKEERARNIALGYVRGMDVPAPAVISLNSAAAAAALNEFIMLVSGTREVNVYTEIDLLGAARSMKAQWSTPRRVERRAGCVQCAVAGSGDDALIARYVRPSQPLGHE